jgi:hypothetical protein
MTIWRSLERRLSWFRWYRRQARDADLERELEGFCRREGKGAR